MRARAVEAGFQRHLLKSWGPAGLRYHEPYPWSNTRHASFHEMGYVLAALNRWLEEEPGRADVEARAAGLVRGMRQLIVHRKIRTFWSGDFPYDERVYEFPGDVYLWDGGFAPERVTGRGEEAIRNGVLIEPLVTRAARFNDPVALDLAEGLANHLLGLSRYFNYRGEFFGHVHSAVWVALGLARLGRLLGRDFYIEKSRAIYRYVKSLSSEFGWVPEYAQWHPPEEEHCETCCIRDMIECALELIDAGDDEWEVVDRYTRNQFSEQQIKDGAFVAVDSAREDADGRTWRDMDRRIVGGWSGGGEPNSINLQRFRSIAGCCAGTAPQALWAVWSRVVERRPEGWFVNLPMNRDHADGVVRAGYPNEGFLEVKTRTAGDWFLRIHRWMGDSIRATVNGRDVPLSRREGCAFFPAAPAGATLRLEHPLRDEVRRETCRGLNLTVTWRGPDVVRLDPPGPPLRLYQRELGRPKEYPKPPTAPAGGGPRLAPTEQKR